MDTLSSMICLSQSQSLPSAKSIATAAIPERPKGKEKFFPDFAQNLVLILI